ncbi:phage portal protein [Streptomyces sp. NPDC090798]|uniref:phage portal protein n=1 Tax=Streptomyces sp. NPDC090798 TaxID=3365968 RepID=UPI0038201986
MGKTLFGSLANALRTRPTATPVPFASRHQSYGHSLFGSNRGTTAELGAMGSVSTLFAIVNRTAKAEAGVEWGLYRKAKSGKKEDRVQVTSHAALDLWDKPNAFYTQSVFVEAVAQHKQLTGEQWWVIGYNERSTIPLELWPVRPDRMTPVPDPETFLSGYMYTGPDGQQVALRKEDVIFIRTPHPEDPYRGIGPVQALLTDLDAVRYSAEWNRNFFLNSAEPGGIIEVPNGLSDAEFNELRDRWNEQHKGVANAHRVAILEHGQWKDRKFSQRDMQFAELRDVGREIIREAFGFPKPMLGSTDDVNRANGESGERMFARWLIVPDLEAMKDALNNQLLPLYGPTAAGLEFDYANPVPEDVDKDAIQLTSRSNAAAALVQAGFDPAGTLSAVGLPDIAFTPPAAPPAAAGPAPAALLHRPQAALPAARTEWDIAVAQLLNTQDTSALDQVRADHDDALSQLLDRWIPIEDRWINALGDQIRTAVDDDDTAALASLTVDSDHAADVLREALGGMAKRAAGRMVDEAAAQGVTVDAPELDEAVTNRLDAGVLRAVFGSELVGIAAATAGLLGSGLASAAGREALRLLTPGADGAGVARQVKSFLRGLSNRLKLDQLGGALHRATNVGRVATLEAAPVATYTASEVNDANRCTPCSEIDGTQFADLDAVRAAYGAGPYRLCQGGIRCRGTVVATWDTTGDNE